MNKLTDEQATQAEKIIDDYNKKYKESIRNIAKHRVPCNGEDSTIIAGRELNVEDNEIIFPPYGQGFKTNLQDYITIKVNNNEKSIKEKNIGKE